MKTIVCRICGSEIDASLGICPHCGTVFYVAEEPAAGSAPKTQSTHSTDEIKNADNDELFNTRVWKTNDPDATRVYSEPHQDGRTYVRPPEYGQGQYRPAAAQPQYRQQSEPRQTYAPEGGGNGDGAPSRKKIFIIAGIALAAVAVLLIAIMSGAFNFHKNSGGNTMPSVVGSTQESAVTVIENLGMVVKINTRESQGAAGIVLEQSIKEGSSIIAGQEVTLTISRAVPGEQSQAGDVEVISVIGKRYEEAYKLLADKGLRITRAEDAYDKSVPEGYVITQSPLKGAVIKEGDIVTLTVSKGEEPVTEYTITVTAGAGGSVSPSGAVKVQDGGHQSFTITPSAGYEIREIKVDGGDIAITNTVTIANVTSDRTLYVAFGAIAPEATPTPPATIETPAPPPPLPEEPTPPAGPVV